MVGWLDAWMVGWHVAWLDGCMVGWFYALRLDNKMGGGMETNSEMVV